MIYDFCFHNTSKDSAFFLHIIALQGLEVFCYTSDSLTHCLLPDYAALLESYTNSHTAATQTSPARDYLSARTAQDSARITDFATHLSSALPLSLHFRFHALSPITPSVSFYALLERLTESLPPFENLLPHALDSTPDTPITPISHLPHPEPKTHYYSAQEAQAILESKDSHKLNAASSAHKPLALPDSQYFAQVVRALQNNERVCFDTQRGAQILSLTPSEGALTLLCDISSLKTYFRCHKAQIDALASFEKPLTHLIPKEVFASLFLQGRDSLVRLCLPYDMPLALLGALLLQEDIGYFFATPAFDSLESHAPAEHSADSSPSVDSHSNTDFSAQDSIALSDLDSQTSKSHAPAISPAIPAPFCFRHSPASAPQILTISNDGILLDTAIASGQDFASLLRAHALDSESSAPAKPLNPARQLVIYLSTRHNSAFWLKEGESHRVLLPIEFEASPLHIVQNIARDYKSGDELLKNFQAKAPALLSRIFALDSAPSPSQNLTDMLSIAAFVLGFSDTYMGLDSKQELFRRAYGFVRERGPRIDYTLLREGSALKLDYPRVVRSLLSFKCAGVEDEFLAYGVIDSLCEFVATLVRDSVVNLSVDNVLLLGDFLASHIVLDRLLGYLPKHINLTLPKDGWLDY